MDQQKSQRNISENVITFHVPYGIEEIIKKNPEKKLEKISKDELINLAIDYHVKGNIKEAIKYYKFCIKKKFESPVVYSNYAAILRNSGKLKEAEISTLKAIELKPDFGDAYSNLGNIQRDLEKLEEAKISTLKAIDLKPNCPNSYSNLGIILRDLSQLESSEIALNKAIKLKPDFLEAYFNLGLTLYDLNKLDEAEKALKKTIDLKPNYADAHLNLSNVFSKRGKLEEAKKSLIKVVEIKPDFFEAFINLSSIYGDLNQLEEAEKIIHKAIEIKPDSAIAHNNLGALLKDLGRLEEAALSTKKSIDLNPNYIKAYQNLGIIYEDLGKFSESKNCFIKAIEIEPKEEKVSFLLAQRLYLEKNFELAIKYLKGKQYNRSKSLYLGCLLCLDKEKEFNKQYRELSAKNICNAEISGIAEHANIIYKNNYKSYFCEDSKKYIFMDQIDQKLFSEKYLEQLITFFKEINTGKRNQNLLFNGEQTSGNLFSLEQPFIKSLKKAIEEKIDQYRFKFKDSNQGFINNWPKDYILNGWMIGMKKGGFLKQHNHEYGWITGSFYLQIPKYKNEKDSGNIAFSYLGAEYPTKGKDFELTIQNIKSRDICIFPSSLFHQTIPFQSSEERICFVFDLTEKDQY